MPLPMSDGPKTNGRKPKCLCGNCSICLTRLRVKRWRATRYGELEKIKDAGAREINIAMNMEELEKLAREKSGE